METFLYYLLRASILMALFYGFYKLIFGKNTFHNFNRVTLILIVLLVGLLPVFRFELLPEKQPETVAAESITLDYTGFPIIEISEMPAPKIEIPWVEILLAVFIAGSLFAFVHYLIGLARLNIIIRRSDKQTMADDSVLCVTDKDISPFSWMKYIVISRKDISAENRAIINHERAHIHLQHSLDMIFIDLFTCVFWFNPFSWLLRREIQSVHEYQADEQVLNNGIDAKQYQLLLIRKSVGEYKFALANNFRQRDLHKRITMMMKNRSKNQRKWNYMALFPVLFLAMVALSIPKLNASVPEKESSESIIIEEDLLFAENENAALRRYFASNIKYPVIAQGNNSQALIAVEYKVGNDMKVTDINADVWSVPEGKDVKLEVLKALLDEAIRVTRGIPASLLTEKAGKTEKQSILFSLQADGLQTYSPETDKNTVVVVAYGNVKETNRPAERSDNQSKISVSGLVKGKDGFIAGVAIIVKGSSAGTVTDMNGKFMINASKGDVLRFVMVGYQPFEYTVEKSQSNLIIALTPDEEVRIGSKVSVSVINGEVKEEKQQVVVVAGKKLAGKPIFILDGREIASPENIDPENIESITVLKDGSATALYGDRAKDGAIIIITKKDTGDTGLKEKVQGVASDTGQATLTLRGVAGDKKPLIIVDGENKGKDYDMSSLSSENIESISVLKGTNATQVYGNEALDGAVEIMTKDNLKLKVSVEDQPGSSIFVSAYKTGKVVVGGNFDNTEIFINGKKSTVEELKRLHSRDVNTLSASPANLEFESDLHKKYSVSKSKSVVEVR